jgi:hypothetical protein
VNTHAKNAGWRHVPKCKDPAIVAAVRAELAKIDLPNTKEIGRIVGVSSEHVCEIVRLHDIQVSGHGWGRKLHSKELIDG